MKTLRKAAEICDVFNNPKGIIYGEGKPDSEKGAFPHHILFNDYNVIYVLLIMNSNNIDQTNSSILEHMILSYLQRWNR